MKPILFNSEMVNAILQGRKTQTRRIIKTQPDSRGFRTTDTLFEDYHGRKVNPPYQPGDILYVRETWCLCTPYGPEEYYFGYKVASTPWIKASEKYNYESPDIWKPSIHMPKEAARIFLRVKSVWVERLCDISEADAIAEGILPQVGVEDDIYVQRYENYLPNGYSVLPPIASFQSLWQSINGEESWNANPWVWVIEFERIPDPR